jgi:dihydrofolate reductase
MGRKTWESLGRPLPGRRHLVLSRGMAPVPGIEVIRDVRELEGMDLGQPVMVIGGAEIFRLFLPLCRRVHLTLVEREEEGDTFMPGFEQDFREPEVIGTFEGYRRLLYEKPQSVLEGA